MYDMGVGNLDFDLHTKADVSVYQQSFIGLGA
jgi:hypothetical protein